MANRFTETEKWTNKWFIRLKPEFKIAWQYVCENCDCAGVIDLIPEIANAVIGMDIDWELFKEKSEERILETRDGKWWIVPFVKRQQPKGLKATNRAHLPIYEKLVSHGLLGFARDSGLFIVGFDKKNKAPEGTKEASSREPTGSPSNSNSNSKGTSTTSERSEEGEAERSEGAALRWTDSRGALQEFHFEFDPDQSDLVSRLGDWLTIRCQAHGDVHHAQIPEIWRQLTEFDKQMDVLSAAIADGWKTISNVKAAEIGTRAPGELAPGEVW